MARPAPLRLAGRAAKGPHGTAELDLGRGALPDAATEPRCGTRPKAHRRPCHPTASSPGAPSIPGCPPAFVRAMPAPPVLDPDRTREPSGHAGGYTPRARQPSGRPGTEPA